MAHHLHLPEDRRREARDRRDEAAEFYRKQPVPDQHPNGDTELYQVFSKGLIHDDLGVVIPSSFDSLLKALDSGKPSDFEAIEVGAGGFPSTNRQLLTDPQAGLAWDTECPDTMQYAMPAPPKFLSREAMGEIAEDYWMALLRDVAFTDYDANPVAQAAADHLTSFGADFKGPKDASGKVTTGTLFRTALAGATTGPLLSQFLVWDIPYGSQKTPAQVYFGFNGPTDYMVPPDEYLKAQEGYISANPAPIGPYYLKGGREMSQYVHIDELFQAYLNACLLLISPGVRGGFNVPRSTGIPYTTSKTQMGFGTLGDPNFKVLVAEIATRALKAVWYQKWFVHRRQRPENFAARIHYQKTGAADYGLDLSNMDAVLGPIQTHNQQYDPESYMLPMAFPEGAPTHPAYGAGHATVAGACVTILKALFDGTQTFGGLGLTPQVIDANGRRVPWTGDASTLTIWGELNKLAGDIANSRNMAGVHWRSDSSASLALGECIAMNFLRETAATYNEGVTFTFPDFSGTMVTIETKRPTEWEASDFTCAKVVGTSS
jgi:membrane-associated phospholipid phosphatase